MGIGDYINTGILLFTALTVFFAKRTLAASDSPRIIATWYKERNSWPQGEKRTFKIGVTIENLGKGTAIKTFLLLIMDDGSKVHYHLSKPIVNIKPDTIRELEIQLDVQDEVTKRQVNHFDCFKANGVYIISQDFYNNLSYTKMDHRFTQERLFTFSAPIRPVFKYGIMYFKIKRWLKKSKDQENTYLHRESRKRRELTEELTKAIKSFKPFD